jgi:hypothetical protein
MRKAIWNEDTNPDGVMTTNLKPETAEEHKLIKKLVPWATYVRPNLRAPISVTEKDTFNPEDLSVSDVKEYEIVAGQWLIRPNVEGRVFFRSGLEWKQHPIRTNPYSWVALRLDKEPEIRNSDSK